MHAWNERRRTVRSNGAELAVFEYGPDAGPDVPTLLLVHGYPDDHRLYLPLIAELASTHHLVAYDTRNAGLSSVTEQPGDFTVAALVEDLFAVLSTMETAPVHLVGHDWGSIQGWAAVQDPRAAGAISRYTSISGPDLGHVTRWMGLHARTLSGWPPLIGQLLRSMYVAAFQIPVLPEAVWRLFLARCYEKKAGRSVGDDPVRGLALYRANFPPGRLRPGSQVALPVHVLVPVKDPFVSSRLVEGLESWVPDLTVTRVDGGHWWPATRPAELAEILRTPCPGRK